MTNHVVKRLQPSILALLRRALSYIGSIQLAATSCEVNFRWMHFYGRTSLPLLDFDIICGALPTFVLRRQAVRQAEGANEGLLFDPIGPHTLRAVLSSLEDYTLPPGTIAEMLTYHKKTSGRLSDSARGFLKTLDDAQKAENPSEVFRANVTSVGDALLDDISQFTDQLRDLALLEQLLKKRTPIESFYSAREDSNTVDAFKASYHFLQNARSAQSLNNFHDAINVAAVVRLYNSQSRLSGRGRMPVLISDTELLKGFDGLSRSLRPFTTASPYTPALFNSHFFLLISQGLLNLSQGRYLVAADFANLLAKQAGELAHIYSELLLACRTLIDKGATEDSLSIDDLPSHELSLLLFKRTSFQEEWQPLLAPSISMKEQDRTEFLNLIISSETRRMLNSQSASEIRDGVKAFEQQLRDYRHPEYDIWDLLSKYSKTEVEVVQAAPSTLFRVTFAEQDGRLLRELEPGKPLDQFDTGILAAPHDLRLAVFSQYLPGGALLAIDSWCAEPPGENARYVSVVWAHKSDAHGIGNALAGVLANLLSDTAAVESAFYTRDRKYAETKMVNQVAQAIRTAYDQDTHIDFIQLAAPSVVVYADIQPLHSVEKQAAITFDTNFWTEACWAACADAIAATIEIPLNWQYVSDLLNSIGPHIGLVSRDG